MDPGDITLIDRQSNDLAFQIFSLNEDHTFNGIQRHNYYSILLISSGEVELQVEFVKYNISEKAIVCISPYQPYSIRSSGEISGSVLNFHSDFYCTYKHHNEIPTEGVLFHNILQPPFFPISDTGPLLNILNLMKGEMAIALAGQHESLVSYLKIFLVQLVRIKSNLTIGPDLPSDQKPKLIQDLLYNIESHYREKHSPADYADMLSISATALGKMVKRYFDKTLSNLIANRIMVEAKRELYLTSKSVKEISFRLGYKDEYYFSRFFKKHAGISPKQYRTTVGFAKQEA